MTDAVPRPRIHTLRRILALVAVVVATVGGEVGAMAVFGQDKTLSAGTVGDTTTTA